MNKLKGNIVNIISSGNVSLVEVDVKGCVMSSMIIGNPDNTGFLKRGKPIVLLFKESEVSIAKDLSGAISIRNQLQGTITGIRKGKVFSEIIFEFNEAEVHSLITTRSAEKLELKIGDAITGLIKSNEIILSENNE